MYRLFIIVALLLTISGIGVLIFNHFNQQSNQSNQKDMSSNLIEEDLTLRRQTLIVRDIDKSLALYRDAIGMEVIYDQVITREIEGRDEAQILRLVFLKATNNFIGVLGLVDYEYGYPDHPDHKKPVPYEGFTPGNSVLVFNANKLNEIWPNVEEAPDVKIISKPKLTSYPGYEEGSIIRVMVSKLYDPDGFIVELNQVLDPLK